jgi:hypothetical protein
VTVLRLDTVSIAGSLFVIASSSLWSIGPAGSCVAQEADVKSQPPWAYTYQVDKANRTAFLATTPALNDGDVWLLLACTEAKAFSMSLMDADGFPYTLGEQAYLTLQLDKRQALVLSAAVINRKQIAVTSDSMKELFPLLRRSKSLSASVAGWSDLTPTYIFSLQPNDAALRDIDIHCFQSGA